jgi:hypothetical protein
MTRLTLTLAAWISLVSGVSASLTPRKDSPPFGNEPLAAQASKLLPPAPIRTAERGISTEYLLTEQTEVLLNGKPCKYEKVPAHASIVHMEVAADNKTLLTVHFRTRK